MTSDEQSSERTRTITDLLQACRNGQTGAQNDLVLRVLGELRRLAAAMINRRANDLLLHTSSLVSEAWIRLVTPDGQLLFENRRHFFGAAAKAMRCIIVDTVRRNSAERHGGHMKRQPMADFDMDDTSLQILEIDELVAGIGTRNPLAEKVFELRFFAGLGYEEIARQLDLTLAQVRDKWDFAKSFLRAMMGPRFPSEMTGEPESETPGGTSGLN